MDKIKCKVDEIIKNAKERDSDYNKQRKEIIDNIIKFYKEENNYTDFELLKQRDFLSSQKKGIIQRLYEDFLKNSQTALSSVFTSYFTVYLLTKQKISSEIINKINTLGISMIVASCVFIVLTFVSIIFALLSNYRGREYRKYNIIELELDIISTLINKQYNMICNEISTALNRQQLNNQVTSQNIEQNNANSSIN